MTIEFDSAKDAQNAAVHGISLAQAETLLRGRTVERVDDRRDYGETRIVATGEIGSRLWTCVYTRRGAVRRVISLRPASRRERYVYQEANARNDR